MKIIVNYNFFPRKFHVERLFMALEENNDFFVIICDFEVRTIQILVVKFQKITESRSDHFTQQNYNSK